MPLLSKIITLKKRNVGIFFYFFIQSILDAMFVSRSEPVSSSQVKTAVCCLAPAEANPAEMFHMWGTHTVCG